jgi:hypothetical protein
LAEDSYKKEEESVNLDSTKNGTGDSEGGDDNLSNAGSDLELNNESKGSKINTTDSNIEKTDDVKSGSVSKGTSNHDEDGEDKDHSFNFHEVLDNDLFDSIRSRKDQILRYAAAAVGVILIIYGIVLISASVTKVADNVIFGEGASYAAFLMLLGFLIIVGAFSQKILNKTFLKNINSELEIAEGKTKADDKKTEEPDGKKDPSNVKDDKDNIVGEDKK